MKRSPCNDCIRHPCKESQKCEARWKYVQSLGDDHMKAVDTDGSYRILPK